MKMKKHAASLADTRKSAKRIAAMVFVELKVMLSRAMIMSRARSLSGGMWGRGWRGGEAKASIGVFNG